MKIKYFIVLIVILWVTLVSLGVSKDDGDFGKTDAVEVQKKTGCKFEGPEVEEGTVSRVQEYNPPFKLCGVLYLGKITILENGVRYRSFVYAESKDPRFPPQTTVYDSKGVVVPPDQLIEKIKEGRIVDYVFALRILDKVIPNEEKGLLIELRVRQ